MVTDVGVLPTHTRRGVASALMREQLRDAAARGVVVATLHASEAVIYERYGYGVATRAARLEIDRRRARLRPGVPTGGPVRLVPAKESWDLQARIHRRVAHVGATGRPEQLWYGWRTWFATSDDPAYLAVHGDEGAEDGYAFWTPVDARTFLGPHDRRIRVRDLVATTPAAGAALLRLLLGIDLLDGIEIASAPVDHAYSAMLLDERAVTTRVSDETWLRLVDVGRALSARTYRGTASVTVSVTDTLLPANTGTWRVDATQVRSAEGPADLELDVAALAAAYLGGTPWWQLAAAGRVRENRPGALAEADDLFGADAAPYGGTVF